MTNCAVEVVLGSTRNGFAGAFIPTHKPYQNGYGLVANLSVLQSLRAMDSICQLRSPDPDAMVRTTMMNRILYIASIFLLSC